MAHHTISLRASFDTGFDNFDTTPLGDSDTLKPSGTATANTDPPMYASSVGKEHWTNQASTVLHHIDSLQTSLLTEERLDRCEPSMYHHTEADVVRAATLYLLHPINQALSSLPHVYQTFKCQSELTSNNVRGDITYYKSPSQLAGPHVPSNMRAFLVLEFKRRGTLRQGQFNAAMMPHATHNNPTLKSQWLHTHVVDDEPGNITAFRKNATVVIKQASAYAISHGIQYVALFDWNLLVLVRFHQFDPTAVIAARKINGVGEECELTVISDSGSMRRALLGFIHEAWQNMNA